MGVAASTDVNISSPPVGNYDFWGYVPPGLTPPQHSWSELYTKGYPPTNLRAAMAPYFYNMNNVPTGVYKSFGTGGQGSDILQTFGKNISGDVDGESNPYQATVMFPNANTLQWPATKDTTEVVCTPETYPYCDMTNWSRYNNKQFTPWSAWWGYETDWANTGLGNPIYTHKNTELPVSSQTFDGPATWATYLNNITDKYLAGQFDLLNKVNSKDTSGYDPCAGSGFFETVLPLAAGLAAVVVPNIFGFEFIVLLPKDAKGVLDLALASTGYSLGKVTMLGSDSRAVRYKEKAANSICLGAGYVGGVVGATAALDNAEPWQIAAVGVGSALLARRILFDAVVQSLRPASFGLGIVGFVLNAFDDILYFFCRWANWGMQACDDHTDKGFPDARKWDVASVAAQLADRAAAQEGWGKDDPRREFVFRGLLTGPAMSEAAVEPQNRGTYQIYQDLRVNPLGSWLQVHSKNTGFDANNSDSPSGLGNYMEGTYSSITGQTNATGWWGTAGDHNRYACNNIDVILNAAEDDGHSEEGSQQRDNDKQLATNLKNWIDTLIAKARDPNNIRMQGVIPGMPGAGTMKFDYDSATYLATCADDFHGVQGEHYGTGFNHVRERGNYATNFGNEMAPFWTEVTNEKQALLAANLMFASLGNELDAISDLQKKGVRDHNIAMIVQYWHKPKGEAQRWSFDNNWAQTDNGVVQKYLYAEVAEFVYPFCAESHSTPLRWRSTPLAPPNETDPVDPGKSLPITRVLDPLSGPPRVLPGPNGDSAGLAAACDAELKMHGWEAVQHLLRDTSFPDGYTQNADYYVAIVYYMVAIGRFSPDDSATRIMQQLSNENYPVYCGFLKQLKTTYVVLFGQLSDTLQTGITVDLQNCQQ